MNERTRRPDASRAPARAAAVSPNGAVPASLAGDDSELLVIDQVAAILKVPPSTIRHWTREGRMPCVRLGPRATRWTRPLLRQFVESMTDEGRS